MTWILVGLGNPGEEYTHSRHNVGRMVLEAFHKAHEYFTPWKEDKKTRSLVSKGKVAGKPVVLMLPQTFMNNSGGALKPLMLSAKKAEALVVVHDDLDLPFGTNKMAFGKGAGGHRGIESIIKALKTKNFVRIRIGVAPTTPSGKIKKPQGEEKVLKHILGEFSKKEMGELEKMFVKIEDAVERMALDGREVATGEFNR